MIVLASDGIAAERQGSLLGQYRLSGELNKSSYPTANRAATSVTVTAALPISSGLRTIIDC